MVSYQIYVLTLATLDLLCVILSAPREIITLFQIDLPAVVRGSICKATLFCTYHLNLASVFILVVIATSRYVKVVGDGGGGGGRCPRARLLRAARATNTVRGAKVACVAACVLAVLLSSPVPFIFGDTEGTDTENETKSESGDKTQILCSWSVSETNKSLAKGLHVFLFLSFLAMAAAMCMLYGAIWRRMREQRRKAASDVDRLRVRQSSVLSGSRLSGSRLSGSRLSGSRLSGSLGTLCDQQAARPPQQQGGGDHHPGPAGAEGQRLVNRTMSEGDAVALASLRVRGTSRAVSNPTYAQTITMDPLRKNNRGQHAHYQPIWPPPPTVVMKAPDGGNGSDDDPDAADLPTTDTETNRRQTFFPPVSYSAQLRSLINLSIAKRKEEEEEREEAEKESYHQRQGSVTSFQFSKRGNRERQTTLVFVLITAIYVLSYLPYFVVVAYANDREEPSGWEVWASRSYLISNAANPLVYGLCNPYFRTTLWKIIICRREVI